MATPRYSVVITAHNARADIAACLRSVAAQEGVASGDIEIILVDDRSSDGTADAARALGLANLRLFRVEKVGEGPLTTRQQALTLAIGAARGQIVLTLDADGVAAPSWLRKMVEPIEGDKADAVAGGVSFRGNGTLARWQTVDQAAYLSFCRIVVGAGMDAGVLFGNFAFRKVLFAEIGGFERIGYTLTEDLAFARALIASGARIRYNALTDVEVEACPSWSVLVERAKRVSAGGVSGLAVVLGLWMASLVVLAVLALALGGVFGLAFLLRYLAGVGHVAFALIRARQAKLLPLALLYEPLAIVIGLVVMLKLTRNKNVEWGGKRYER